MAQDIINLTPGSTPITPNIAALIGVGDPNATTTDTDLNNAVAGSLFIRRDGASGAEIYQKASSTPTWRPNAVTPVFDVRAYGATGNGTTDDYPALNAAVTAAGASIAGSVNGATVYVPPGTYLYKTSLILPANVALELEEGATLSFFPGGGPSDAVLLGSGGAVRGQSALACKIFVQGANSRNGIEPSFNCTISDVWVQGSQIAGSNGITTGSQREVVIDRCLVTSWEDGINAGLNSVRWTITNTVVHDCTIDGIFVPSGSTDFVITNNHVFNIGHNGIDTNGARHVIANNWVQNIAVGTTRLSDFWGILLQAESGSDAAENVISGNRVDNCAGPGISLRSASGANCRDNLVTGNIVTNCGAGIGIDSSNGAGSLDRNAIVGNVTRNNPGGAGIYVYGNAATSIKSTLIANNIVTGNATNAPTPPNTNLPLPGGIYLGDFGQNVITDTLVSSNLVLNNGQAPTSENQINFAGVSGSSPIIPGLPDQTNAFGNKVQTGANTLRIDGPPSTQKWLFIQTYDSNPFPHAIVSDAVSTQLVIIPSGGHRLVLEGTGGSCDLKDGGFYQISGTTLLKAQQAGTNKVTLTAGSTYTSNEENMLNQLAAAVNQILASLCQRYGGHGLLT